MGRSYEERVSSYRKTFGPEGAQGQSQHNVKETREQVSYRYGELESDLKRITNFYSSSNLLNSSMGGGRTTPTGSTRRVRKWLYSFDFYLIYIFIFIWFFIVFNFEKKSTQFYFFCW